MLFLSDAMMPLEIMPKGVVNASKLLPLTYGVDLLKGVVKTEPANRRNDRFNKGF